MKKFLLLTITLFTFGLMSSSVKAFDYETRDEQGIPALEQVESRNIYIKPSKIVVSRVDSTDRTLEATPDKWIKYIYYYLQSRLGFQDIPYNYFVDKSGNIYQGKSGFEGAVPELANNEGVITIGYLSNSNEFTSAATRALRNIIGESSARYGISANSVVAGKLSLVAKTNNTPAKVNYALDSSAFTTEFNDIKQGITFSTSDTLSYDLSVEDLKYAKEVKAGEKLTVELNVKNNAKTPLFLSDGDIFLMTADGQNSSFAVNGVWDSFKDVLSLEEGAILPGKSLPVKFEMQALLLPGPNKQSFKFARLGKSDILNSNFDVEFSIVKGDFQLVEIIETETGTLNIRENPAFNGKVLAEVEVGRIVIMTGEQEGWIKIKYTDTLEGWVLGRYAKKL